MRAQIFDADALRSITPAGLAGYARADGWTKTEDYGEHSDVYEAKGKPEIILPRTQRLGDYSDVIAKLISIFAETSAKDELAVFRDLVEADRDVVRIRACGSDGDGSIPIDAGVEIVAHARDMLLAAACAVRAPQPLYRAGANKDAIEYMRRVRLGQTEKGSFVVTLLAPVPPLLQPQLDPTWSKIDDDPYDRQVTRRLMEALEASRLAAEMASGTGFVAFERVVAAGVSANLCEAVASLIEQSSGLDISMTWARTRPTAEMHRKVVFLNSDAEILKEAARTFRQRQPKADVTLFGTVHKLKRDQEEVEGVVTLKARVDDKMQSVRAVLDQANYSIATRAHETKTPVIATGDLERVGQRWQMTNAKLIDLDDEGVADDGAEEV